MAPVFLVLVFHLHFGWGLLLARETSATKNNHMRFCPQLTHSEDTTPRWHPLVSRFSFLISLLCFLHLEQGIEPGLRRANQEVMSRNYSNNQLTIQLQLLGCIRPGLLSMYLCRSTTGAQWLRLLGIHDQNQSHPVDQNE